MLKANNAGEYPLETYEHDMPSSFCAILGYMQGTAANPIIHFDNSAAIPLAPSFIGSGNYSDSELTILRKPVNRANPNEFKQSSWMVVNHEHSYAMDHWNGDATSFQLYYQGKLAVIEGGYQQISDNKTLWTSWLRSPYSHNMLIINPDSPAIYGGNFSNETDYLAVTNPILTDGLDVNHEDPYMQRLRFWYDFNNDQLDFAHVPRKNFLYKNEEISHLKVSMKYNNNISPASHPFPADLLNIPVEYDYPCMVERNFYDIGNSTYVIFDKVSQLRLNPAGNEYRNQMYVLADPTYNLFPDPAVNNTVKYQSPGGLLKLSMGSTAPVNTSNPFLSADLPLGWRPHDNYLDASSMHPRKQRRVSILTQHSTNPTELFVTMISPSASYYGTIFDEEVVGTDSYGLVRENALGKTFCGVQRGSGMDFARNYQRIDTSAEFFVVETDFGANSVRKAILSGDGNLTLTNVTNPGLPLTVLETEYNAEADVWTAEWEVNTLKVTIQSNDLVFPKYRILRQSADPGLFQSRCVHYTGGVPPDNDDFVDRSVSVSNINTLMSNDDYIYVNYTWDEIIAAGLDNGELTIYMGSIPGHARSYDL